MKRKNVRACAAAGILLFFAAAASFGLPGFLFRWQDEKLEGQVSQEEAAQVVLTDQPELTIVEKVRLMRRESSYSMLLDKGRIYSQDTIEDRILQELDTLQELGILSGELGKVDAFSMEASFMMDVEGEDSAVFWTGELFTDEGRILSVTVDDETGRILELSCSGETEAGADEADSLISGWGAYLGCHVASSSVTPFPESDGAGGENLAEFEKEIEKEMSGGLSEQEARENVREAWGMEEPGFSASVYYGDESGWEMGYQFQAEPLYGGSMQIWAE